MPKKKQLKKSVKKVKVKKKETAVLLEEEDLDEEDEGDIGEETDEVGAEPVYSKDDDDF